MFDQILKIQIGSLKVLPDPFSEWITSIDGMTGPIIAILVGLGGLIALFLVVTAGYSFMTSGADPVKIKNGKEQMQNALLGFLLILLSVGIAGIVFSMFQINVVEYQ